MVFIRLLILMMTTLFDDVELLLLLTASSLPQTIVDGFSISLSSHYHRHPHTSSTHHRHYYNHHVTSQLKQSQQGTTASYDEHDYDDYSSTSNKNNSLELTPNMTTTTVTCPKKNQFLRIYTRNNDDGGQSFVEPLAIDMIPFVDKEGAYGLATNVLTNIEGIVFRSSPPGYELLWHCAPRRQYMILLSGIVEIEVGIPPLPSLNPNDDSNTDNDESCIDDGADCDSNDNDDDDDVASTSNNDSTNTIYTLYPGDVLLAEDLTGYGHVTRVVGDEPRFYAILPLIDDD